tara:strand:+ start:329 stop:676 length:348 start_codon:yes stop_codon:yes gene_type:complete
MDKRRTEIVKLVISQTDYDQEKALERLIYWNGNYLNVIKEYLNPDFNKKVEVKDDRTVNQKMMSGYRDFMDDVYNKFHKRKMHNEKIRAYMEYCENLEKEKNDKIQAETEVEVEE